MAKSVLRLKELATSVKEMKKALADKKEELKQEKNKYKELVIKINPLGSKEAQV
jgi:Sec-independent protein translocase protein TatA